MSWWRLLRESNLPLISRSAAEAELERSVGTASLAARESAPDAGEIIGFHGTGANDRIAPAEFRPSEAGRFGPAVYMGGDEAFARRFADGRPSQYAEATRAGRVDQYRLQGPFLETTDPLPDAILDRLPADTRAALDGIENFEQAYKLGPFNMPAEDAEAFRATLRQAVQDAGYTGVTFRGEEGVEHAVYDVNRIIAGGAAAVGAGGVLAASGAGQGEAEAGYFTREVARLLDLDWARAQPSRSVEIGPGRTGTETAFEAAGRRFTMSFEPAEHDARLTESSFNLEGGAGEFAALRSSTTGQAEMFVRAMSLVAADIQDNRRLAYTFTPMSSAHERIYRDFLIENEIDGYHGFRLGRPQDEAADFVFIRDDAGPELLRDIASGYGGAQPIGGPARVRSGAALLTAAGVTVFAAGGASADEPPDIADINARIRETYGIRPIYPDEIEDAADAIVRDRPAFEPRVGPRLAQGEDIVGAQMRANYDAFRFNYATNALSRAWMYGFDELNRQFAETEGLEDLFNPFVAALGSDFDEREGPGEVSFERNFERAFAEWDRLITEHYGEHGLEARSALQIGVHRAVEAELRAAELGEIPSQTLNEYVERGVGNLGAALFAGFEDPAQWPGFLVAPWRGATISGTVARSVALNAVIGAGVEAGVTPARQDIGRLSEELSPGLAPETAGEIGLRIGVSAGASGVLGGAVSGAGRALDLTPARMRASELNEAAGRAAQGGDMELARDLRIEALERLEAEDGLVRAEQSALDRLRAERDLDARRPEGMSIQEWRAAVMAEARRMDEIDTGEAQARERPPDDIEEIYDQPISADIEARVEEIEIGRGFTRPEGEDAVSDLPRRPPRAPEEAPETRASDSRPPSSVELPDGTRDLVRNLYLPDGSVDTARLVPAERLAELDDLVTQARAAARGEYPKMPPSLRDFVAGMGGVRPDRNITYDDAVNRIRLPGKKGGFRSVITAEGRPADDMARAAMEAGYLDSHDLNRFYDLINEDLSGNRVYSNEDIGEAVRVSEEIERLDELARELTEAGINLDADTRSLRAQLADFYEMASDSFEVPPNPAERAERLRSRSDQIPWEDENGGGAIRRLTDIDTEIEREDFLLRRFKDCVG